VTTASMSPEADAEERPAEGGEMTLLEHLLELRSRITWSAAAIVLGMVPFFYIPWGRHVINFLLDPAQQQNPEFRAQAITPMENIVTYFRVALLGAISLAMPVLIYQVLAFVTPALTPGEKRWVFPIVLGASLSFVVGLAFGYWVVLPTAYGFLFSFGSEFAEITPTISSYMDLTTRLLLVMGLVFETPLLIMGLAKFGVVSARKLLGWWRWALIGSFVISAIATPTPDPITQTLVGGPIFILYMLGIVLAWFIKRE
jgi:sec-independent protein translocase protein TatC